MAREITLNKKHPNPDKPEPNRLRLAHNPVDDVHLLNSAVTQELSDDQTAFDREI